MIIHKPYLRRRYIPKKSPFGVLCGFWEVGHKATIICSMTNDFSMHALEDVNVVDFWFQQLGTICHTANESAVWVKVIETWAILHGLNKKM